MITPYFTSDGVTIFHGDCLDVLRQLPDGCVHAAVTSCPYWGLRDYGVAGQFGLERCPDCLGWATGRFCGECYVCHLAAVFREVRRVLRKDGTLWLNLGHTYAGHWGRKYAHKPFGKDRTPDASTPPNRPSLDFAHSTIKPKDLIGIPWRVALALQADGWYLRSDVIWHKPSPLPESVRDRPTCSHEYLFLLSPSRRYYFDRTAIAEPCVSKPSDIEKMSEAKDRLGGKCRHLDDPRAKTYRVAQRRAVGTPAGRNKRSVWTIATQRYRGAHFAVFPEELITPCILASTSAAGCCATCGAPYRRTSDRPRRSKGKEPVAPHSAADQQPKWEATCRCVPAPPVPCVVLDPFLGSGTTAAVAQRLACRSIGIELNEAYCHLAIQRFRQKTFFTAGSPDSWPARNGQNSHVDVRQCT